MKIVAHIAALILGGLFLMASIMYFVGVEPPQPPPPGSPVAHFMEATGPTGFMTFVKVFELLGAVLVIIPFTRNFGLLVLGPIILNILAFHAFIAKGGLADPMLIAIVVCALFLLWTGRKAFAGLAR